MLPGAGALLKVVGGCMCARMQDEASQQQQMEQAIEEALKEGKKAEQQQQQRQLKVMLQDMEGGELMPDDK